MSLQSEICPKSAYGMTNTVDPDQSDPGLHCFNRKLKDHYSIICFLPIMFEGTLILIHFLFRCTATNHISQACTLSHTDTCMHVHTCKHIQTDFYQFCACAAFI